MKKLIKEQNVAKKALTDAEIRSYEWNTKIKPQRDKLEQQLIYIKQSFKLTFLIIFKCSFLKLNILIF